MEKIIVYITFACPNCVTLKELLTKFGLEFAGKNMRSAEGSADLFANEVYAQSAPILRLGDVFYVNLTDAGKLDIPKVKSILGLEV